MSEDFFNALVKKTDGGKKIPNAVGVTQPPLQPKTPPKPAPKPTAKPSATSAAKPTSGARVASTMSTAMKARVTSTMTSNATIHVKESLKNICSVDHDEYDEVEFETELDPLEAIIVLGDVFNKPKYKK